MKLPLFYLLLIATLLYSTSRAEKGFSNLKPEYEKQFTQEADKIKDDTWAASKRGALKWGVAGLTLGFISGLIYNHFGNNKKQNAAALCLGACIIGVPYSIYGAVLEGSSSARKAYCNIRLQEIKDREVYQKDLDKKGLKIAFVPQNLPSEIKNHPQIVYISWNKDEQSTR